MKALKYLVMVLVVVSMVLTACAPKPTPTPVPAKPTKAPEATKAPEKIKITWWSHWAEEDNKKKVINQVIADYEAAHPNVDIEITWWQKKEMFTAMRNAFTAGEGGPDIFYFDWLPEFVEAGWIEDLADDINWDNVLPSGKDFWTREVAGKTGTWAMPLEASNDLIIYNKKIFREVGIEIPKDRPFTIEEFYDVCKKIHDAGYDVFSQGIADRGYPGQYLYRFLLLEQLGADGFMDLFNGKTSWDRPEVREAIEWAQKIAEIPAFPETYTTMTLAEMHRYFHTEEAAAMLLIGAWYTGRAMVPPEQGGQPNDFELGFLRFPTMPNGKGNGQQPANYGGALAVYAQSPHKDVAVDIVNFFAQPKYGNLWFATTAVPTGIKLDPANLPPIEDPRIKAWLDAWSTDLKDVDWRVIKTNPCGDLNDAYVSVLNEGWPQLLLTVDEGIAKLEEARAKCQ